MHCRKRKLGARAINRAIKNEIENKLPILIMNSDTKEISVSAINEKIILSANDKKEKSPANMQDSMG